VANEYYSRKLLQNLKEKVLEKGMFFDFPDLIENKRITASKKDHTASYMNPQQPTLMNYM